MKAVAPRTSFGGSRGVRSVLRTARDAHRELSLAARRVTADARVLPSFLVIGAMKAGTTSLYAWLIGHENIVAPAVKEPQFFTLHYDRGERWYRSSFPTGAELLARGLLRRPVLTGEATPYSLFHPLAAERAFKVVPKAKLIALLRDPVTRAWSHYRHERRHGREPLGFMEAIEAEDERLRGVRERLERETLHRSEAHQRFGYLARGRYAEQLERWFRHFPREQVLLVKSEELFERPARVLSEVTRFLGIPEGHQPFGAHGVGGNERLDATVKAELQRRMRGPNERLRALVGRDFGWNG